MNVNVKLHRGSLATSPADALVAFRHESDEKIHGLTGRGFDAVKGEIERRSFKGKLGSTISIPLEATRSGRGARLLVVAGLGPEGELSAERMLTAVAAGIRAARALEPKSLALSVPPGRGAGLDVAGRISLAARAAGLSGYRFDRYVSGDKAKRSQLTVSICSDAKGATASLRRARTLGDAVALARDLVNEPPSAIQPATFAAEARKVARREGLKIKVMNAAEVERQRMGALAAVGRGSDIAPRVVHMSYVPSKRAERKLALVGKGVTFDSGGYNLKGSGFILDMKCDMAGAAAVLGTMQAIARLRPRVEVHALLGLVENLVSGNAYKPGDVLTSRSGKTIEINNTDAEGRLVMADLIDFACTEIGADVVVDVATLTGACVVALGPSACGLMSNDERFRDEILDASRRAGERIWPLPLYDDYRAQLDSDIADMKNTGQRFGGALTAGLFLKEFVRDGVSWAHLDIAGPAFLESPHPYNGKGGTGFGVTTLTEMIESW